MEIKIIVSVFIGFWIGMICSWYFGWPWQVKKERGVCAFFDGGVCTNAEKEEREGMIGEVWEGYCAKCKDFTEDKR